MPPTQDLLTSNFPSAFGFMSVVSPYEVPHLGSCSPSPARPPDPRCDWNIGEEHAYRASVFSPNPVFHSSPGRKPPYVLSLPLAYKPSGLKSMLCPSSCPRRPVRPLAGAESTEPTRTEQSQPALPRKLHFPIQCYTIPSCKSLPEYLNCYNKIQPTFPTVHTNGQGSAAPSN